MLESDDDEAEEEEALDDEVKEEAILLDVRLKEQQEGEILRFLDFGILAFFIKHYPHAPLRRTPSHGIHRFIIISLQPLPVLVLVLVLVVLVLL